MSEIILDKEDLLNIRNLGLPGYDTKHPKAFYDNLIPELAKNNFEIIAKSLVSLPLSDAAELLEKTSRNDTYPLKSLIFNMVIEIFSCRESVHEIFTKGKKETSQPYKDVSFAIARLACEYPPGTTFGIAVFEKTENEYAKNKLRKMFDLQGGPG